MLNSPQPFAQVDGWPINIANMDQAVAEICDAASRRESFAAFTLNLDHLVKLRHDDEFRHAYGLARYVMADGAPVAYLASRGGNAISRTTGADLVAPLAQAASEGGLTVYLFGTTAETLASAGRYLAGLTSRPLQIVGSVSPRFGFDATGPEADAALDRIAASGAHLCFVALSPPKGEIFAARGVEKGVPCGFVCIGAGLDFLSGRQVRAPKFFQDSGIEWAWRLGTNPKRFAVRYARCAAVLADIALREARTGAARQRSV